jgi:cytosine/adenosine deaminase-related metal-dependent hydrolase
LSDLTTVIDRRYSNSMLILRARTVITMQGAPIDNGAVAVSDDRITDVGKFDDIKRRHSGETLDLGEQALLPGLINAHCHLDYTCLRGKIPPPKTFTDWIRAIVSEKEKLSAQDYIASIGEGFAEAKKFGTTTIANLTAFPELVPQVNPPIRTWWFAELIDVREWPEIAQNLTGLTGQVSRRSQWSHWGLAPHAPFTASRKLYRECEETARREDVLLTTHLAESRDEMEMFSKSRGPLFDFLAQIGRDCSDLHGATPVEHLGEFCTFDQRWLLVHLNEMAARDAKTLLRSNTLPHAVHCPRSHAYFGHSPFPFRKLRRLGFNICLATDSLASNDDLNLFREMRAFQRHEPTLSPRQILETVTVNAARALGQGDRLGQIAPGFFADLIALPCAGSTTAFEEIVAFKATVGWMIIDGKSVNLARPC